MTTTAGTWAFFGGAPGGGELLLVFVVFLLLFGAKKLPGSRGAWAGRWSSSGVPPARCRMN